MRSHVALVPLLLVSWLSCADILDLDEYEDTGAIGASDQGGALVCGDSPTPPAAACPLDVCNGGCSDTRCIINCNASNPCFNETMVCPLDWDCEVNCEGDYACEEATIVCPAVYACTLRCNMGNYACRNATVECARGPCIARCRNNSTICGNAVLVCGENSCKASCDAGLVPPELDCTGMPCECEGCAVP